MTEILFWLIISFAAFFIFYNRIFLVVKQKKYKKAAFNFFLIGLCILVVFNLLNYNGQLSAKISNIYSYAGNPVGIGKIRFTVRDADLYTEKYHVTIYDKEDIKRFCEIVNRTKFERYKGTGGYRNEIDFYIYLKDAYYALQIPAGAMAKIDYVMTKTDQFVAKTRILSPEYIIYDDTELRQWVQEMADKHAEKRRLML